MVEVDSIVPTNLMRACQNASYDHAAKIRSNRLCVDDENGYNPIVAMAGVLLRASFPLMRCSISNVGSIMEWSMHNRKWG